MGYTLTIALYHHFLLQTAGSLLRMPQMVSTCLDGSTWPAPSKYARQQQHLLAHGTLPCDAQVASSFRELRSEFGAPVASVLPLHVPGIFKKKRHFYPQRLPSFRVWRRSTFGNSRASFACASSSCKTATATVTSSHF